MISHATVDEPLAQAWDLLLRTIFSGATTWFSAKRDAFSPEDNKGFAARIEDEIRSANFLLTIQTPNSRMRPWLVWEAALAVGAKIPTFVVLYSIKPGQTGNPLDGMHQYSQDRDNNGDKDGWVSAIKDIEKIIGLIAKTNGVKSDPGVVGVAIEAYLRTIEVQEFSVALMNIRIEFLNR